ncbi:venom carboxylesterase-6 [Nasonia vitripennis]|uniref:Carboxylic ester hydrolase n=1 Tax=Nasonia vitripennis TaxID=7425 RepID=A0A7M7G3W7_NASVI|nr:venom carboxylesterase-6 [Nasonia vitripennis]
MEALNVFLIILIVGSCFCQDDSPKVSTPLGKIKGHYKISNQGKQFEAYEGIPYALPPIAERRFQPPVPVKPWKNELIANNSNYSCMQHRRVPNAQGDFVSGDEDCLYLNIYVPIRKTNESLPIIFWIHGGAFQYGTGLRFGPKYLTDYNVILVTINYRLGVLGFLSTEDQVVSGNMGLKDQSVALRWISDNIKYFGGDPKKVTLTGLSAGGASVHYHYLSPMSAGLFSSGISHSGTSFNCWTQTENSREKALLAELVNCPTFDIREMIKCFQNRPARILVTAEAEFMPWRLNPFTPFGPVAERDAVNPFIDRSPIEIINSGDVQDLPWVTGITSEEGLYPVAEFALNDEVLKELDKDWESIAPYLLDYYYTIPKYEHAYVARVIREHYFGNKTINKENVSTLIQLVGDRIFGADAEKAARAQAYVNKNPVWFFYYSHRASHSVSDSLSNSSKNLGVCHGDDTSLILENRHIIPTRKPDIDMQKDLIKFWVTVARTGIPKFGPKWLQVNPVKLNFDYLHIAGPGNFKTKASPNFGQRIFWQSINFDENWEIIKHHLGYPAWNSSPDISVNCITLTVMGIIALYFANI